MIFFTKIPIPDASPKLDYHSKVLLLGSCFSENIGEKFSYYKFQQITNPLGIIFNPVSIGNLISRAVNDKFFEENDLFNNNQLWHCFDAHSQFSGTHLPTVVNTLNQQLKLLKKGLQQSNHIIITLGTAWVYRLIENNCVVANCHKINASFFNKQLLSIPQINESLSDILNDVHKLNPKCCIIFTISPVRHIKDGFVENTQSKSHLIAALHQLINDYDSQNNSLHYFPSFEIIMDELRDYRFYNPDLLHPNEVAINYIWQRFNEVWMSKESIAIQLEIEKIQKSLRHQPFFPDSEMHQEFQNKLTTSIKRVKALYPHIDF